MRHSELLRAVDDEFGALGSVLLDDLALPDLDGRTGRQALRDGERPRTVWLALCEAKQVAVGRRHGVGRIVAD